MAVTVGEQETTQYHDNITDITKAVFVVYGHDTELKRAVETALHRLGLEPIFLDQHADGASSIIERIEHYSGVQYAVILVSPDDIGRDRLKDDNALQYRARQNVVLEFGYFIAHLGRSKIAVLTRGKTLLEFPSDIAGIFYEECDESGEWKEGLRVELGKAGFHLANVRLSDISLTRQHLPEISKSKTEKPIQSNPAQTSLEMSKIEDPIENLSESGVRILLSDWWDHLDGDKKRSAIWFNQVDKEVKVPTGSAQKHLMNIVVMKQFYAVDEHSPEMVKFKKKPPAFVF